MISNFIDKYAKDARTLGNIALAVVIGVATSAAIGGIQGRGSVDITLGVASLGVLASILIITHEFTKRGREDETEKNEKYHELTAKHSKLSREIDPQPARILLKAYNKSEAQDSKEREYQNIKDNLEIRINKLQTKFDYYKEMRFGWWRVLKRWRKRAIKKKITKLNSELKNLDKDKLRPNYEPIDLEDIRDLETDKKESKKSRYGYRADKATRAKMLPANIAKTLFFSLIQIALFVSIDGKEIFFTIVALLSAYTTTAFTAYISTVKGVKKKEINILGEKIEDLEWLKTEIENQKEAQHERTEIQPEASSERANEDDSRQDSETPSDSGEVSEEDRGGEE